MKRKTIVLAAIAVGTAVSAFGQYNDHRDDRDRAGQFQRGELRGERGRDLRPDRREGDRRHDERGAGPRHDFYRGDRLPLEYRHRQYVVDNWRLHHLRAPPRGYYWVQTGADYVLVAQNTGVIIEVVINP